MTNFESWLHQGLGRAALFLRTGDRRRCRGHLLHACTHNLAYDPQCESSRAPYLLDLIELSGEPEFYRDRIIEALGSDNEDLDFGQMFEIAAYFADRCSGVRDALYAAFERLGFARAGAIAAEQLVALDGLSGLLVVMRSFGQVDADQRPWRFQDLIEVLEKHHAKRPLPSDLDPFMKEWQDYEDYWAQEREKAKPRLTYEALLQSLTKSSAMAWARNATADQLALAAGDLLRESDEKRLICFLWMFRHRPFPLAIEPILALAKSSHNSIAHVALAVLSNVTDQRVRQLGLDLIAQRARLGSAIDLLTRNPGPGDYRLFEELLAESHDAYLYHSIGMDIRCYARANRSQEAEASLLMIYEHGPCSTCRHGVVKELLAISSLPAWMLDECLYDCDDDTRKMAATAASGTAIHACVHM